jgi:diguanylate cyclase (GGDEF)-like protein
MGLPDQPEGAAAVQPASLGGLLGVDAAASRALRHFQELVHPLTAAGGGKALIRRFGEVVSSRFGARRFDSARLAVVGGRVELKRRNVPVDGVSNFGTDVLERLGKALSAHPQLIDEARDGATLIDLPEGGGHAAESLFVAVVDDVKAEDGCLVIWDRGERTHDDPGPLGTAVAGVMTDLLARTMQQEARWLRKLDRTQALLYRDDLTGLFNMRFLEVAIDGELRRAGRFQTNFCLLFIDLDSFKPINDTHGHLSGSSVLKQVAEVIKDAVREIDIAIRYGGDEFVVLLLGATCAKGVLAAERVRRRIEARAFRLEDGGTARVTASIGVAAYPDHGRDRESLLKVADETMYASKHAGKNRVTVIPGQPGAASADAAALESGAARRGGT